MLRFVLSRLYAAYAAVSFALVVLLVLCPLIILGPTLAIRRATGRFSVRAILAIWGVPFHVRGSENLPAEPAIVVCNHASYMDGLVLTAALPARYTFVVQDGAANWPYVGWVIKRMGVTFVNRSSARAGAAQTRALIKRLQDGESLTIFAEGTFKDEASLLPFKTGAFLMAARAGVPVVPAAVRGTRRLLGGGSLMPRWSRVEVEIAAPLHAAGADKQNAIALRDTVRAEVLKRCGEPDSHAAVTENGDDA